MLVVAVAAAGLLSQAQTTEFKPVTEAMLANPDPADWINWRRTRDGWGYSPLSQIDRENVDRLQLVWSRALSSGISQPTPLVYGGLMYLPQARGVVQALDARTGDLVWEYVREFAFSPDVGLPSRMRSLAMYGTNVYVATPDAHIVALDARTGAVVWDHEVADQALGYRYTSGPLVVGGRIVAGMTGCERYKDDVCFISAHDARTGEELWRTSTIARPGEAGGDTWGDLPLNRRAGGDAWIPGSYDPATNLIYWSVAQAKPWARISRGTDGDALYTNSLLALDPDSGRIVWYHQFIPGETHDLDEVFESVLIDRPGRPGRPGRRSVFKMGKLGVLWELDRTTGDFVAAHDLGYQNVLDIDPGTGRASYRPGMLPVSGVEIDFCPDIQGVRNWRATAYHPATQALYISVALACQRAVVSDEIDPDNLGDFSWYGRLSFTGFDTIATLPHPASPDERGALIAMDVATGRVLWRHSTRTPPTAATLTTGGGLVIGSDSDRNVYLHDVETGDVLFETRLPSVAQGFPVTYAVEGRQYIAIPTGGPRASSPPGINALYVFALPVTSR